MSPTKYSLNSSNQMPLGLVWFEAFLLRYPHVRISCQDCRCHLPSNQAPLFGLQYFWIFKHSVCVLSCFSQLSNMLDSEMFKCPWAFWDILILEDNIWWFKISTDTNFLNACNQFYKIKKNKKNASTKQAIKVLYLNTCTDYQMWQWIWYD